MKRLALATLLLLAVNLQAGPPQVGRVPLKNDSDTPYNQVALPDGRTVPAQVTAPPLLANSDAKRFLTFVLPDGSAKKDNLTVQPRVVNYVQAPPQFNFVDTDDGIELQFDKRPVIKYMNAAHDTSSPARHELTFKPFHHVYDPITGKTLLTNGAGLASNKTLLFPHHRGLFFAFNRISYDDQTGVDTWHGRRNEFTSHDRVLESEAGEVLARQRSALTWHGKDSKPFASEIREVTVYNTPGGTLIDWASQLSTDRPQVKLDGDPQHAGFHFRAAMEVAKNGKQNTYYLRPDGKGKIGETRNWEPKTKKGPTNLPWNAMSFVVKGQRYTVLRIDHPDNPKESRGSERDYGRFGDYFEYTLTPAQPLKLRYRVWVQPGEMTVEQCAAMAKAFTNPINVSVK